MVNDPLRAAIQAEIKRGRSVRDIARAADLAHTLVAKYAAGGDIRLSSAYALAKAIGKDLRIVERIGTGQS